MEPLENAKIEGSGEALVSVSVTVYKIVSKHSNGLLTENGLANIIFAVPSIISYFNPEAIPDESTVVR